MPFSDITPCSPFKFNWLIGGIYRLNLQGRIISQTRNHCESYNKQSSEDEGNMFLRNVVQHFRMLEWFGPVIRMIRTSVDLCLVMRDINLGQDISWYSSVTLYNYSDRLGNYHVLPNPFHFIIHAFGVLHCEKMTMSWSEARTKEFTLIMEAVGCSEMLSNFLTVFTASIPGGQKLSYSLNTQTHTFRF
jgi:hypothetical protein